MVIFSFCGDKLLEVQAIAKDLEACNMNVHAINEMDNFRMHWATNAKRSQFGVCCEYDHSRYRESVECQKEMQYLEGRAAQGKMLLLKIKASLFEKCNPGEIAGAVWFMMLTVVLGASQFDGAEFPEEE